MVLRPAFQAFAWVLLGMVGVAGAILALFFGGLPAMVVFLLVLFAGGLWWWQSGNEESDREGGRPGRPDES